MFFMKFRMLKNRFLVSALAFVVAFGLCAPSAFAVLWVRTEMQDLQCDTGITYVPPATRTTYTTHNVHHADGSFSHSYVTSSTTTVGSGHWDLGHYETRSLPVTIIGTESGPAFESTHGLAGCFFEMFVNSPIKLPDGGFRSVDGKLIFPQFVDKFGVDYRLDCSSFKECHGMVGTYRDWKYEAHRGTLLCAVLVYMWAHHDRFDPDSPLSCLVEKGATLNPTPGWEGPIPLFLAVSCNDTALLEYLVANGMDIHYCGRFRGRYGNALDHAVKNRWEKSAQFLRDHGLVETIGCTIM